MMRRRGMSAIWGLVKPLIIYYAGYYVARMILGTLLAGGGMAFLLEEGDALVNGIAMVGGLAALFPMIGEEREEQRRERRKREREEELRERERAQEESKAPKKAGGKDPALRYFALAVFAVASVVFFNTLISLSGLAAQSAAFQETAKRQYAVSLGMGLFLYAGISPVAEEVVFRFLLYNRLRRSSGKVAYGVFVSAFLFGVYHGNVVQGSYAFVLGVLIACAYFRFDSFFAPVLFHGLGNAAIFLGNMIPEVNEVLFSPVMFWICGLVTAAGCLYFVREKRYSGG